MNISSRSNPPGLAPSLRQFIALLGILTLVCILAEVFSSLCLHRGTPYNWPLMPKADPFRDFYLYQPRYRFFHSYYFFLFPGADYMYPAPVASVYRFFYLFPHSTNVFLAALSFSFLLALLLFARALLKHGLAPVALFQLFLVLLFCSYPFAFEFEQANMEWIIWLFVAIGLWTFLKHHGYTAAVCFGVVGALKLYPLIFIALFLPRRQYRQFALAIAIMLLVTVGGLWLVDPNLSDSWTETQRGIARFGELYIVQYQDIRFDHSLFALFKWIGLLRGRSINNVNLAFLLARYLPIAALSGFAVWVLRIRRLPVINQVLCLTIATILLPPVSYDYTLLHLYLPWAMLVFFTLEVQDRLIPGLTAVFCCFAILFAPETEFIMHKDSFGGQIKAMTLLLLLAFALSYRFASSFDTVEVLSGRLAKPSVEST